MNDYDTRKREQFRSSLVSAVESISHGDTSGPMGLEAVTMALAGEGTPGHTSVTEGLFAIAEANQAIAEAINRLAATQEPMAL